MTRRRLMPVAIAVVILAVISAVLWWINRSNEVPDTAPSSAPAAGTCWNVDAKTASAQAPWGGASVACTAPHTVEVFYVGQVDHKLIRTQRKASGEQKKVNTLLMAGEARAGCTQKAPAFLGDSPRGVQVAVLPDFVKPAEDGFYVCAIAQSTSPNNEALVTRSTSLRDSATALGIDCVASTADGVLSYVSCDKPHDSEYAGTYTVTPLNAPFNLSALQTAVPNGCKAIVGAFMGLAKDATRADVSSAFVGPTASDTWLGSDQSFSCYAHTAKDIAGSLAGWGARPLP